MPLTAIEIRAAKPGRHPDGAGLYLNVRENGTKSWIYRYQISKRRREMGLGSVGVVSASEARAEAHRLKLLVARGLDPLDQREEARQAGQDERRTRERERVRLEATFRQVAEQYLARHEKGWTNPKHRQQWANPSRPTLTRSSGTSQWTR